MLDHLQLKRLVKSVQEIAVRYPAGGVASRYLMMQDSVAVLVQPSRASHFPWER